MSLNAQPFYTGPVRAPFVPGTGFVRPPNYPIGAAVVPRNLPGPIWPGQGPGRWHVGPSVGGGMPAYTMAGSYGDASAPREGHQTLVGAAVMGAVLGGGVGFIVPSAASPAGGAVIGALVSVIAHFLA